MFQKHNKCDKQSLVFEVKIGFRLVGWLGLMAYQPL